MSGSHELWLSVVNRILGDSPRHVMIDVCCGACAVTRKLTEFDRVDASDILPRDARVPAHWNFDQFSAIRFLEEYGDKQADLVICSDGLEHFNRNNGNDLLLEMERVGRTAIIFTPTGDDTFDPEAQGPHHHKSSWMERDFHHMGWETEHFPDWHPTLGWGAIFAWKNRHELP